MGRIEIARGFLSRLARDVRGNTIGIMAAAILPLIGMIGGGVDMSRLYLTKTRLQHACDAGALAGRKAMGAGSWTTGSGNGSTNDKAEKMFAANFAAGNYGTGTMTKSFSNNEGTILGTAQVTVPMTVLKIFGMADRQISVSCNAKMELPNTDVMFVLDVTYSMQCAPSATSDVCSPASAGSQRVDGLKKAVKCFYEALYRVATPEPCTVNDQGTPTDYSDDTWSSTGDPTATTASTTAQVRMGFVPYGVNVNVGKILPNSTMADSWTYQSREANLGNVYAWTLGTQTNNLGAVSATPDQYSNGGSTYYNSFATVSGADTGSFTMADGTSWVKKNSAANSAACTNLNTYGSYNQLVGIQESLGSWNTTSTPTSQNPPVYPATTQNLNVSQTRTNSVTYGYKYVWTSSACYLQRATAKTTSGIDDYNQTQSGTGTKPITWTPYTGVISSWDYEPRSLSVSALKAGGSTWNNSITMSQLGQSTGPSVTLSGQSTAANIYYPADLAITWDGCIEEAPTVANSDYDPSDEWGTRPTAAYDMDINLVPSSATSYQWGPMLRYATWARYNGSTTNWNYASMLNQSPTAMGSGQSNWTYMCTTSAARKLAEYPTSTDFLSYVNSLAANDLGTYHDIGLLWGGRLLSPLGIFASENATASGGAIQRHMIFMTDGNTRTVYANYNAYGLAFFNRKQTTYDPVCGSTCTYTDALVNARLLNLCTQIKNLNITLWVVSYGSSVNTDTQNRLKQCATPGESLDNNIHFVSAESTSKLTKQFQDIAAKISELRLIS